MRIDLAKILAEIPGAAATAGAEAARFDLTAHAGTYAHHTATRASGSTSSPRTGMHGARNGRIP